MTKRTVLPVLILSVSALSLHASTLGSINGTVRDSSGSPVVGALVVVAASIPGASDRLVFTDRVGRFAVPNLFAGQYSIRVTTPRFLPAEKSGIQLATGATAVLTVNLQSALDIVRRASGRKVSEDVVWALRSAPVLRPVLRLTDTPADAPRAEEPDADKATAYTGFVQVYSNTVDSSGSSSDALGSQFAVSLPLPGSRMTFAGQYSETPSRPSGFGATYEFAPSGNHRSTIGVHVRQGALFGDPIDAAEWREVRLQYAEDFQLSDNWVVNYGAEVGHADTGRTYLRPSFGVTWIPASTTALTFVSDAQGPAGSPSTPNPDIFDRALFVPAALERYAHQEVRLSHSPSERVELSAAVFADRTDSQALFVRDSTGRRGIAFLDTRNQPSAGIRVSGSRRVRGIETGLGYVWAHGFGFGQDPSNQETDEIGRYLRRQQFHAVTARVHADIEQTRTQITAIYRWTSGRAASQIDPYQKLAEFNDPTLSISVAQNLPSWRLLPGRFQAVVDARNLFEPTFGAARTQISQYPRLVKGGINIRF